MLLSEWWCVVYIVKRSLVVFQIDIEGIRGSDYRGDIAVDDVGYHNTLCAGQCLGSEVMGAP